MKRIVGSQEERHIYSLEKKRNCQVEILWPRIVLYRVPRVLNENVINECKKIRVITHADKHNEERRLNELINNINKNIVESIEEKERNNYECHKET